MDYQVIRSRRRTIALQIQRNGQILVRAPLQATDRDVEHFIQTHRDWIASHLQRRLEWLQEHPEPSEEQIALWRRQAKEQIPSRVAYWSQIMGLSPTGVKITAARHRFGSCNGRNSLCFSLFLMQYPPEVIDYVVVHELAHIRHFNHGPEFYRTVEQYLPDWQQRKAQLKYCY
ncbi:MAG: M48 family metallopeptidase [Ruminococcaceae bacterium]|nr:M48 family metallopeptidase [Oscillospiraceae bacterium]